MEVKRGWNTVAKPFLACEQALWDALAPGWVKEGELATTSLEYEYLHRKSQCKMLIGRDDIRNYVITLGMCFSMIVYIRACCTSRCLAKIWQLSRWGATGEVEVEFKFQRHSCKFSFLSCPGVRALWIAWSQAKPFQVTKLPETLPLMTIFDCLGSSLYCPFPPPPSNVAPRIGLILPNLYNIQNASFTNTFDFHWC